MTKCMTKILNPKNCNKICQIGISPPLPLGNFEEDRPPNSESLQCMKGIQNWNEFWFLQMVFFGDVQRVQTLSSSLPEKYISGHSITHIFALSLNEISIKGKTLKTQSKGFFKSNIAVRQKVVLAHYIGWMKHFINASNNTNKWYW